MKPSHTPREWWITDDGGALFESTVSRRPIGANSVHVLEATPKVLAADAMYEALWELSSRPNDYFAPSDWELIEAALAKAQGGDK